MANANRRPLIAGNWKLNKTIKESVDLVSQLKKGLPSSLACDVAVAPVFTALSAVGSELSSTAIKLAAQDTYWEDQGAFTGEVSAFLLRDVGCDFVIIGHSERRQFFGETDQGVNRKTKSVLSNQMIPIVCVGETKKEREAGTTLQVILSQVSGGLQGLSAEEVKRLTVAYEPVWAIGTGLTASPADAQDAHRAIRDRIAQMVGRETADTVRILYGGSVKADNAAALLAQPDLDGALVGGASLTADSFLGIIKAVGK
jgi:triosephosphate isomerase (TIM)